MDIEIITTFIGGLIAGVIGIIVVYYSKGLEEKKTKKSVARALYEEVKVNQAQLKFFKDTLSQIQPEEVNLLRRESTFYKTVYSALAGNIGLLGPESIKELVLYYAGLTLIEEEWQFYIDKALYFKEIEGKPPWSIEEAKKIYLKDIEVTYKSGLKLMMTLEKSYQ